MKPLVYINLKFAGHAEAWPSHTEQVLGRLRVGCYFTGCTALVFSVMALFDSGRWLGAERKELLCY